MLLPGTILGDKAEVESTKTFYANPDKNSNALYLGASKSIFGHTEPVSGLLSILKIILASKFDVMPPTLFVTDPAEALLELTNETNVLTTESPIALKVVEGCQGETMADSREKKLYAATSNGMSGTTSHVLLSLPKHVPQDDAPAPSVPAPSARHPKLLSVQTHSIEAAKAWISSVIKAQDGNDLILPSSCLLRGRRPLLRALRHAGTATDSTTDVVLFMTRPPKLNELEIMSRHQLFSFLVVLVWSLMESVMNSTILGQAFEESLTKSTKLWPRLQIRHSME